jgi:hypothetical protein
MRLLPPPLSGWVTVRDLADTAIAEPERLAAQDFKSDDVGRRRTQLGDRRIDLGLAGLPEPELAARQRVLPGVHLDAPGPTRQLLYVTGRGV